MNLDGRRLPKLKANKRKYYMFIAGMVGVIGLALYPTIIAPIFNPEPWSEYLRFSKII